MWFGALPRRAVRDSPRYLWTKEAVVGWTGRRATQTFGDVFRETEPTLQNFLEFPC